MEGVGWAGFFFWRGTGEGGGLIGTIIRTWCSYIFTRVGFLDIPIRIFICMQDLYMLALPGEGAL